MTSYMAVQNISKTFPQLLVGQHYYQVYCLQAYISITQFQVYCLQATGTIFLFVTKC